MKKVLLSDIYELQKFLINVENNLNLDNKDYYYKNNLIKSSLDQYWNEISVIESYIENKDLTDEITFVFDSQFDSQKNWHKIKILINRIFNTIYNTEYFYKKFNNDYLKNIKMILKRV